MISTTPDPDEEHLQREPRSSSSNAATEAEKESDEGKKSALHNVPGLPDSVSSFPLPPVLTSLVTSAMNAVHPARMERWKEGGGGVGIGTTVPSSGPAKDPSRGGQEKFSEDDEWRDNEEEVEKIDGGILPELSSFTSRPALTCVSLLPTNIPERGSSFSPRLKGLRVQLSGSSQRSASNGSHADQQKGNRALEELDRLQLPSHHTSLSMQTPPPRYHEFKKKVWPQELALAAKGGCTSSRTDITTPGSQHSSSSRNSGPVYPNTSRQKRLRTTKVQFRGITESKPWSGGGADAIFSPETRGVQPEGTSTRFGRTQTQKKSGGGVLAVRETEEERRWKKEDQGGKEGEGALVLAAPSSTSAGGGVVVRSPASTSPPVFITATSLISRDGVKEGGLVPGGSLVSPPTLSKMSLWPLSGRSRSHLSPISHSGEVSKKSQRALLAAPSRAPLALQMEAFIRKEHRQFLLHHPGCAKAETLEIFREAFRVLTEHFSEYRAVLNLIQDEYDAALAEVQNEVKRMRIIDLENKSDRSLHAMELSAVKESLNATISNQQAELLAAQGLIRGLREQLSAAESANNLLRHELRQNHSDQVHGQEQVKLLSNALIEEANRSSAMVNALKSKDKDMELLNSCVKVLREEVEELHLALMEQLHIAMDQRQQLAGLRGGRGIGSGVTSPPTGAAGSIRGLPFPVPTAPSATNVSGRKGGVLPSWGTSKAADGLSMVKEGELSNAKDGASVTSGDGKGRKREGELRRPPFLVGEGVKNRRRNEAEKEEEEEKDAAIAAAAASSKEGAPTGNTYPELYVVNLLSRVDTLSWEVEQWKQKASQYEGMLEDPMPFFRGPGPRCSQGPFSTFAGSGVGVGRDGPSVVGGGGGGSGGRHGGGSPGLMEAEEGQDSPPRPSFESPFFMESGLPSALPFSSSQLQSQLHTSAMQGSSGVPRGGEESVPQPPLGSAFPRFSVSCSSVSSTSQVGVRRSFDGDAGASASRRLGGKGGGMATERLPSCAAQQSTTHYSSPFSMDKNAAGQDSSYVIESGSHTANALAIHSSLILPQEVEAEGARRNSEREGTMELSQRRSSGSSSNSRYSIGAGGGGTVRSLSSSGMATPGTTAHFFGRPPPAGEERSAKGSPGKEGSADVGAESLSPSAEGKRTGRTVGEEGEPVLYTMASFIPPFHPIPHTGLLSPLSHAQRRGHHRRSPSATTVMPIAESEDGGGGAGRRGKAWSPTPQGETGLGKNGMTMSSSERGMSMAGGGGGKGKGTSGGSGGGFLGPCMSASEFPLSREGVPPLPSTTASARQLTESGTTVHRLPRPPAAKSILGGGGVGGVSDVYSGIGRLGWAAPSEGWPLRQESSQWSAHAEEDDRDHMSEFSTRRSAAVTVHREMYPIIKAWLNTEGILEEDLAPTDMLLPTGLWPGMDMSLFGLATPVKHAHLTLAGFHKLVKRIWLERESKVSYTRLPTFFMKWLENEAGGEYQGKVLGVNIVDLCQRNLQDSDCYVFLQALRGYLSEEIALTWRKAMRYLRHACENNTHFTETGEQLVQVELLFEAIRGFFPEKPVHNMLQLRFSVYRASGGGEDVVWPRLLKDGSPFIETLKRQLISEVEAFTLMVVERVRAVAEPLKPDQVQVKNVMKALQSCDSSMPDYMARKLTAEACLKTVRDVAVADDAVTVGLQLVLRRFRTTVLLRRTGVPSDEEEAARVKAELDSSYAL